MQAPPAQAGAGRLPVIRGLRHQPPRRAMRQARLQQMGRACWLLEELRVSFFAQELRTPQPVSVKRLDKAWSQLL